MGTKRDFLAQAYGAARQAGLPDTAARLAASQAALETGFGRSVKGNNYFGIKAGRSWKGPTQSLKTWEEVGGRRVNISDRFRAYANPAESMRDWANLVSKNWSGALSAGSFGQAAASLRGGLPGGYATDSRYASKLGSINNLLDRNQIPQAYNRPDNFDLNGQLIGSYPSRPPAPVNEGPVNLAIGPTRPLSDVVFPGFDGVQRAPLTTTVRAAPAMPVSAAVNPLRPSASLAPSDEYMLPAPNSPVAMPQSPAITQQQPTMVPTTRFQPPTVPQSMPSSLAPTAPRGDPFGSVASQDNFGNSLVTNQYGVTTATMPDGKQAAYGKGTAGPLGRTSLLGKVGMPGGAPGLVGGLLGAAIGGALLGPVGGVIGGLAGKSLIGGGLGRGGFPAAPGTFGESKGKALSKSERSDISPAASRSMDRNGGKMTGLW